MKRNFARLHLERLEDRTVPSVLNTPPSVNAGADATIDEGGTFSSSGSFTDPDADIWTATVNYGDGSGDQPLALNPDKTFALSHFYADEGRYFVTVVVTDDHQGVGSDGASVLVNNVLPVVSAGPDATIDEGDTFTGSGFFTDPGADFWVATVDYGDASGVQPLALNPDKTFALSHVFTVSGVYVVEVSVEEFESCDPFNPLCSFPDPSDTLIVTVNKAVSNTDPTVDIGPDVTIDEGTTFSQSGSFTDPDADIWTATVNYGDGSGVQPLALNSDKTFALNHTYADDGPYLVTVTVSDDQGGAGSDGLTVIVNNVLPAVNAGPDATIDEGDTFAGSGFFTDPGADFWVATVDYGDASGVQPLALNPDKTFALSHVFSVSGVYVVEVSVEEFSDPCDDPTNPLCPGHDPSDTLIVTVNKAVSNTAPTIDIGPDVTIDEGTTFSQSGSFTDPDANSWTATVNYGDGSGVQPLALNPDKTFALNHTYADDGPYLVTVTVSDDQGGAGSDGLTVIVNNVLPAVNAGPDVTIDEGSTFSGSGFFTDPGADTWAATVNYGDGSGVQPLALNSDKTFDLNHDYIVSGVYALEVCVEEVKPPHGDDPCDSLIVTVNKPVSNTAPSNVSLNLDGTVNENGMVTLNGSFTDPDAADMHTVVISWGPGEGTTTLNLAAGVLSFSASHQYLDDNPSGTAADLYPISVTVTDDDGGSGSGSSNVTVNNVAPQVDPLSGPRAGIQVTGTSFSGVRGQALSFGGSFSDIGTLDTHQASWNFGDGTVIGYGPSTAPSALAPSHTYAAARTYTISLTVRDDDGGEATISAVVTILELQVQADPCDPGLTALVVGGTTGNDTINIHPGSDGTIEVTLNGTSLDSFAPTGRIIAYGQAGDDNIQMAGAIGQQVWLYGDAGNDRLNAGNGGSLLIGGDGNDELIGGSGRDVMVGGEGADRLVGNSNDDILVAGYTTKDDRAVSDHDDFWCAVLDEWNSGNTFAARVRNLKDGLGGNAHNGGAFLLPNVREDLAADAIDFLNGSSGADWLIFLAAEDKVSGQVEAAN